MKVEKKDVYWGFKKKGMEEARTAPFQRGTTVHLKGLAVTGGCGEGEVGEGEGKKRGYGEHGGCDEFGVGDEVWKVLELELSECVLRIETQSDRFIYT
jgi:hypothetical protein